MSEPILEARGVRKRFGPTEALRGADLAVSAGETVAVLGASGSGKSTLLYCLAGILVPDKGQVWFAGHRIDDLRERERSALRRRQFGFVFQFGQLVPELSAQENVALPLLLDGVNRPESRKRATEWLARLGAESVAGARPGELSGGQAQRVAMARALVARPAVVFADEPTGSLDSVATEEVMAVLTEVTRAEGTTMLVVTHESRVAAYANREVVLRDGSVAPLGMVAQ
jgi:putative ABC transport system ATP-binding protein